LLLKGLLAYTFARIGAVVNLKVEDYYPSGKRFLLRSKEKGGKEKELPVHHKLEELLDQYLKASGLETEPESPLFPTALGKTGKLSRRPLVRTDAADMLKRRLNTQICYLAPKVGRGAMEAVKRAVEYN
jgi:integrase/recombinase XerD